METEKFDIPQVKLTYFNLQPQKDRVVAIGKEDLTDWINKILAVKRNCFTVIEWAEGVNCNKNVASKHIEDMRKAELVRERQFPTEDGLTVYEVFDPRILHLLSRGVTFIG